ncbi:hypothetical protein [Peribacillus sp. AS_2]|uniref:hypothetical protein n=1 Tax=Peribacillus sp. AS_2 TaxID=2996755 RepID=UPI0022A74868|nr:hypothetical protein [Peribacillus sp. AS_2]MCZ0874101.1 hypothetical protein [Peribacillus sp. AS_2]
MEVNQRKINSNEKEITYTHIETGSPAICFMFSGAGYTYEKPLFYYSTMIMLQNQYDVVHIHYAYDQDIFKHPLKFDSIFDGLLSCNHSAHIVIGEKDHHYIPDKIQAIENKPNISMNKIPHANHSLDIEPFDTSRTIIVLEGVMNRMEEFLKNIG